MVEYSLTIFTTAISTIAVIMASIFFCCWRKKDTGEANERKPKLKREETVPVAPAASKSENGVAAIQSVSQCEMKVPLLSSPALEDSQDDLGDFSAVQRETDILRTYRKPKPPKRARQSRAPRNVKTDRDSVDVFTQLNEEDSIHGSDKENTDSTDDIKSILLSQDQRKSQRDTCCSMLTDIEQTLAALHVNENLPGSTLADNSLAEDKSRLSGQAPQDNCKDKAIARKKTAPETNDASLSENTTSSQNSPVSSEAKTQPMVGKESPNVIPTAKARKIPKVSHKPSPKPRSKREHQDDCTTESSVLEMSSETEENISIQPSQERTVNNTRRLETTSEVKFLPQPTNSERRIPLAGLLPKATNSSKNTVSGNKTVTNNETTQPQSSHESKQAAAAPTSPVLRVDKKCEDKTKALTTTSSSEEGSDAVCATETHTKDNSRSAHIMNKTKDSHPGNQGKSDHTQDNSRSAHIMNRTKDSHPGNQGKSENHVTNSEEIGDTAKEQVIKIETSRFARSNSEDQSASISQQTSSDRETSPSRCGDVSRGRSEETRKQRRESNEDQTGKGKTSKIPVRAGSKPRSTSPKMLSTDKTASVDT